MDFSAGPKIGQYIIEREIIVDDLVTSSKKRYLQGCQLEVDRKIYFVLLS